MPVRSERQVLDGDKWSPPPKSSIFPNCFLKKSERFTAVASLLRENERLGCCTWREERKCLTVTCDDRIPPNPPILPNCSKANVYGSDEVIEKKWTVGIPDGTKIRSIDADRWLILLDTLSLPDAQSDDKVHLRGRRATTDTENVDATKDIY